MSSQVIISIDAIYTRFQIMPELETHMRTVAKVGEGIIEKWSSPHIRINKNEIMATLLIHDIGNIVKFKFNEHETYWKEIQKQIIQKYQSNLDHEVTKKMAVEIGSSDLVLALIQGMSLDNIFNVIQSDDYNLKICTYADLRVAPCGIVTVSERFTDLRSRYKGTAMESRYDLTIEEAALVLESQILQHI